MEILRVKREDDEFRVVAVDRLPVGNVGAMGLAPEGVALWQGNPPTLRRVALPSVTLKEAVRVPWPSSEWMAVVPLSSSSQQVPEMSDEWKVHQWEWSGKLKMGVLVTTDGRAALVEWTDKTLEGVMLRAVGQESHVTCASLTASIKTIALGTSDGTVEMLHLSGVARQRIKLSDESLSTLRWSIDGAALAVGGSTVMGLWARGGARLWQRRGDLTSPLTVRWGLGGTTLIVAMGTEVERYALFRRVGPGAKDRVVLVGDDRLLVLGAKGQGLDDPQWQHVPLPSLYMADNWPLRLAAVSSSDEGVAVAGRRGVSVWTGLRWRLFGDRSQEQFLAPVAITWARSAVVIAAQPADSSHYEVNLFPVANNSFDVIPKHISMPQICCTIRKCLPTENLN